MRKANESLFAKVKNWNYSCFFNFLLIGSI